MSFDTSLPITSWNHPECDYCDGGVASVPCTCFDWPTPEDDAKRIAELEATTARKGNKKVSVVVEGQINKAIAFWDDSLTGEADQRIIENSASESSLRVIGEGKFGDGWTAGFVVNLSLGNWDILTDQLGVNGDARRCGKSRIIESRFLCTPLL